MIGSRLAHYELLEEIGRGGMGVVYKARDTHLDRDVAVKVLSAEQIITSDRKRRFVLEAKAASALDHSNIITIFDIDQQDGVDFIAMEYVAGGTLSRMIGDHGMSVDEAVTYGIQIASALEAAHAARIVHRDLKPGNVMVNQHGQVKVLDFGLVKLWEPQVGNEDDTRTIAECEETLTKEGTLVGTAAYMSPEQIECMGVDTRSDVFSFGAVLYEMLSGCRAFRGDSTISTLSAVMRDEPIPLDELKPGIPIEVQRVIQRCLAKKPEARYPSAAELRIELLTCQEQIKVQRSTSIWRSRRPRFLTAAIGFLLIAILAVAWILYRGSRAQAMRADTIREIAQLSDAGATAAAFDRARQAKLRFGDDPALNRLWDEVSVDVNVDSDPPGASIEVRDYDSSEDAWISIGTTPMQSVRVPRAYLRWRLSKEGFAITHTAAYALWPLRFKLLSDMPVPEGMIAVNNYTVEGSWNGLAPISGSTDLGQYFIDKYEVTNRDYESFVRAGAYTSREYWKHEFVKDGRSLSWDEAMAELRDSTGRPGPASWEGGTFPDGQGDYPVGGVSWYEAAAYAEFADKSLPTVFHWLYASGNLYNSAVGYILPLANFSGRGLTAVVNSRGVSPSGTYDMAGNVKEWCSNRSGDQRYILGGAWDQPRYMFMDMDVRPPFDRSVTNGFRCVRYTAPVADILLEPRPRRRFRDYSEEQPVTDDVFAAYQAMYAYDKTAINAKIESTDDQSVYWRKEKITFSAAYNDERVIAYLFLPISVTPPFQTVVYFPGSASRRLLSSERLYDFARFDYIIKSGRAFLYPVYWGTYERRPPEREVDSPVLSRDRTILRFKDLARSADYLETRDDIDMSRLAYLGFSWGGGRGPMCCALETRLKTCILIDGGFGGGTPRPEVDPLNFAPRVKVPTLMVNGRYDYTFPLERSQIPMYQFLGTPQADKRHVVFDTAHDVSLKRDEVKSVILGWLDRYLGPVQ